jgi:hypothetical protein
MYLQTLVCTYVTIKQQGVVDKLFLKFRDSPKRDSKHPVPALFLEVTDMLDLSHKLGRKIL